MQEEIPRVYSPEGIEPSWARYWVERKLYSPSNDASRRRYCLVIPPPNITGSLHMGHMLEHTEIDTLMRWHRMSGDDVLWLPGTDHASIATQMIVERELGREALPGIPPGPDAAGIWQREGQRLRLEMGREKFVERCWKWKDLNGGVIRRQMERLGASCDWTRERFTMDPAYSRAVAETFVRLYKERLIYRDFYLVNWCARCGTAISDLEVAHEERQGKLWTICYPFEDGAGSVAVATTRPETMLGDSAVAVNPGDQRYAGLVGRSLHLPLTNRIIRIIADDFVDPAFGTGAVKVTPAHDPNDYAMGKHHHLPVVGVIDTNARIHSGGAAGTQSYDGMDRYEARRAIVRDLREQGLLESEKDHVLSVGKCQRCKTDIEYLVSKQWFMRMKPLAEPAINAVEGGSIRILPESGLKKYLNWMENIHDWCISRQLWWGHRIPAWYCESCGANPEMVGLEKPEACSACQGTALRQETDVLDTWFSSALWPFATLGWPEPTTDLGRFYPTDLMIMGEDILFFWGARMIMMGLKLAGDVPFRRFYIHALVRDAERQKMSKTKGNVLDPLQITEKHGTDAVRFALAISAAPGTDIAFSDDKVEAYRAFANKIWNAGRFVLMNLQKLPEPLRALLAAHLEPVPGRGFEPVAPDASPHGLPGLNDRWIFSRLSRLTQEMNEALENFRFHEAAYAIYHFFWHEFCDWYLEWVKPEITQPVEGARPPAAWINLLRVFKSALHLLHPFMPFITEELWHELPGGRDAASISLCAFGMVNESVQDVVAESDFESLRGLVVAIRNAKAARGLQREKPSAQVGSDDPHRLALFRSHQEAILRLAGGRALNFTRAMPGTDPERIAVTASVDLKLFHETRIDAARERSRLENEKVKLERSIAQSEHQLEDREFLSRAPEEVVRGVKKRHAELTGQYAKTLESLERLEAEASK